jgi:hypothetical protein
MSMMRSALALAALVGSLMLARAEPPFVFRGEAFVQKYASGNDKARLVEFVPPNESLEGWTKLIGYRAIFDNPQSPAEAAAILAEIAQQRYAGAKPRVSAKGAEAVVEFVAKAGDSDVVEFNVFKYAPGHDGRGIVSFQYAQRFRGLHADAARALGARSVAEAAAFDMSRVRAATAPRGPASF